jgi:hypothetical protein
VSECIRVSECISVSESISVSECMYDDDNIRMACVQYRNCRGTLCVSCIRVSE